MFMNNFNEGEIKYETIMPNKTKNKKSKSILWY